MELAAGRDAPRLLLSLSKDGNLRLWDVPTEACLSTLQTDASCIVSRSLRLWRLLLWKEGDRREYFLNVARGQINKRPLPLPARRRWRQTAGAL